MGFQGPLSDNKGEDDKPSNWFKGSEQESGGAGGDDNGGRVDA